MRLCNPITDREELAQRSKEPLTAWILEIGPTAALNRIRGSAEAVAGTCEVDHAALATSLVVEYCIAKRLTPAELDCLVGDLPGRATRALSWLLAIHRTPILRDRRGR